MPSKHAPPLSVPVAEGGYVATPSGGNTQARYTLYLRDDSAPPASMLAGQITAFSHFGAVLRNNGVGSWALECDVNDPIAAFLKNGPKYGIIVNRTVFNRDTKAVIDHRRLFTGPCWGWQRTRSQGSILFNGYTDEAWLATRDAWPVVTNPYSDDVKNNANNKRYYRLNQSAAATNGTTTTDDSGSLQNGTWAMTGGSSAAVASAIDEAGYAHAFASANSQVIDCPATGLPTGAGQISLEVWWYRTANPGANQHAFAYGDSPTAGAFFTLFCDSSGKAGLSNGTVTLLSPSALSLNTWHHVVGTYDGTNARLYVDGSLVTGPTAMTNILSATRLKIGGSAKSVVDGFWDGNLDECALYNTAIATSVANHYQWGLARFSKSQFDTQTGPAETVIKHYVKLNMADANVVDDTDNNSRNLGGDKTLPGMTIDADTAAGATVTGNARFQRLVTDAGGASPGLLQELAQQGGIRFWVDNLTFKTAVPSDRSGTIIFSDQQGLIAEFVESKQWPPLDGSVGNAIIVAGGGQGTSRSFLQVDATDTAPSGHVRFEAFIDARDTSDNTVMAQRANAMLAGLDNGSQHDVSVTIKPIDSIIYGRDYALGDTVKVRVDGVSYSKPVQEIDVDWTSDNGEEFALAVGTINASVASTAPGTGNSAATDRGKRLRYPKDRLTRLEKAQ